jgi:hemerythrin
MQKQRLLRVIEASADESMLSEIHRQQRHIFALTHEYQILAMRDRDNKQLLSLLERIVDAVLANFSTEEAVLAELEPSTLVRLRAIHRRTVGDLQSGADEWRAGVAPGRLDTSHVMDALLVYYFVDDLFVDL